MAMSMTSARPNNGTFEGNNQKGLANTNPIINDFQTLIFTIVNFIILSGFISLFGVIANVINMVIFYRQGLDSTTNISFFAMSMSDLCCLMVQQLFNVYVNPLFQNLQLPIILDDVLYVTSGVPREMFARITCLITVYITAERCLCVTFPLHIKQMITTKTTATAMFAICGVVFVGSSPLLVTEQLGWHFYPEHNRTLLGMAMSPEKEEMRAVIYLIHVIVGLLSFLAVVVFTTILILKLKEKQAWRKTASAQQDKPGTLSSRDRSTMVTVALVAIILIVCYTPAILIAVTHVFVPEFGVGGTYYNLYYVMWSFAYLLENINSSVNIFLYLKMSSKYRQEFENLFFSHRRTTQPM